ncbi:MAG: hypothetical protein HYW57_00425 [Ignavibacteriales bacterium]|nr:hypothetical protein [Ignavibacteriales bacterium]
MTARAIFLVLLGILGAPCTQGQTGRVVELRSADELKVRTVGGEEVRDFIGNVHFVQPAAEGGMIRLWCDRAQQYITQERIELFGNVRIRKDSLTLLGSLGTYFNNTRRARMVEGVRLERPGTVLLAREGDYSTDARRAHFRTEVVVVDSVSKTYCDELTYFEEEDRSIAVGNVRIESQTDAVTVFGDSLVHFGRIDYTLVPKNPKLLQIDTTSSGVVDTLVVISRTMEAYRDSTQRYVARDSVMLVRTDLAGRCGFAVYRPAEGLAVLMRNPVVWYGENQVTGDSIAVRLEDRKLRSVYVQGRAMAVSRSDTIRRERFDQLTGRELTLYFRGGNIERIEAVRNAISLYYLFDKTDPNGINKSSGDRIFVDFTDGEVENIHVVGGVEGQYMPETMIANRERLFNLDGFRWHADKPKRRGTEIIADP